MMSLPWIINCTCTISPTKSILIRLETQEFMMAFLHPSCLLCCFVSSYLCLWSRIPSHLQSSLDHLHYLAWMSFKNCCLIEKLSCLAKNKVGCASNRLGYSNCQLALSAWTYSMTVLILVLCRPLRSNSASLDLEIWWYTCWMLINPLSAGMGGFWWEAVFVQYYLIHLFRTKHYAQWCSLPGN